MAVLIVHTSDLHVEDDLLGQKYTGLVGLRAVLAKARALDANVVLLAGDTFDNLRVSSPVLRQAAELIAGAGRTVILLPGNHDPIVSDCLYRRAGLTAMPNVHVLGVTDPDSMVFAAYGLEIWGNPHRGFGDMAPLRAPRPRTTRWQVAMAHGHYVPPDEWQAQSHRSWRISDADLAATSADYIALGHWDRAVRIGGDSVPAYYSGSPDLAGTANVIRLHPTSGTTVERKKLDLS